MQISNSGRIVVVDDKYEDEAKPLLSVLAKNEIPYLFYEGDLESLPANPMKGIRFIFLDLDLKGSPKATGSDRVKTMASYAAGVVIKLISPQNGPFVIIFWSNHSNDEDKKIIKLVLENCKKKKLIPISYFDMEKYACKDNKGNYKLEVISEKLKEKLKSVGAFRLYVEWENTINHSAKEFINDITLCFDFDSQWNEKTELLMYRLFKTYAEHGDDFDSSEKMEAVYHILNRGYHGKLEAHTRKSKIEYLRFFDTFRISKKYFDNYFNKIEGLSRKYIAENETETFSVLNCELSKKNKEKTVKDIDDYINNEIIGKKTIAKLNTALFITDENARYDVPGTVFLENDEKMKEIIQSSAIKNDNPDSQLCFLLLTPECDIAQRKAALHRVIFGILVSDNEKYELKKGDHLFKVGPLWYNDNIYFIMFNNQTITSLPIKSIENYSVIFSIKRDLFFDLQSKAANHVNRLGNYQLTF
ncbi:hypothetical protein ACFL6G_04905 [candidate division KSB1 bacterium]